MTIDEYLKQPRKLKRKRDRLLEVLEVAEERATATRCALNLGDGIPGRGSNENTTENKLIEYVDAGRAFSKANQQYDKIREEIQAAINNLLYWQGRLIYQVYIFNVATDAADDLKDTEEILNTNDRGKILAKLNEAKDALADQLRAQGVQIDERADNEL